MGKSGDGHRNKTDLTDFKNSKTDGEFYDKYYER